MTNGDVKEIVQIFVDSGIAEMELKRGENSLILRRNSAATSISSDAPSPQASQAPQVIYQQAQAPAMTPSQPTPASGANEHIVKSPIVGTYYEAPKPGDPPFVKVGDHVEPGQVLCIIESMKLMNEIESEVAGVISAKLMENGRPVEYGEALFAIRPR